MRRAPGFLAALFAIFLLGAPARAAFHFMQIDLVIGGVNGDTTAQAVELRMRSASQNQVQQSRIKVFDATGSNPILLKNLNASVPNGASGARVLLTTPNFANYTNIPLVTNFVMDNLIPASYLAAGSLTFEDDFGTVYWRLSWGGAGYTGPTTGIAGINDADGQFGPPFAGPLPSTTLQALDFTGNGSALSTNNAAQYVVTPGAATFINNAGTSFVVTAPPPAGLDGDFNDDDKVDAADYINWRKLLGTNSTLNGNGDETGASANFVDQADYDMWQANFGDMAPGSGGGSRGGAPIPEPATWALLLTFSLLGMRRRVRQPNTSRPPLLRRLTAA
jgi:hypothetical protein